MMQWRTPKGKFVVFSSPSFLLHHYYYYFALPPVCPSQLSIWIFSLTASAIIKRIKHFANQTETFIYIFTLPKKNNNNNKFPKQINFLNKCLCFEVFFLLLVGFWTTEIERSEFFLLQFDGFTSIACWWVFNIRSSLCIKCNKGNKTDALGELFTKN